MATALILDPDKLYAEMAPYTNLVARVFVGEPIPDWAMHPGRKIVEIPAGVRVNIGDRYHDGVFAPPPPPPTLDERANASIDQFLFEVNFDQENRLRALEQRPQLTRVQYRSGLIAKWKELNS